MTTGSTPIITDSQTLTRRAHIILAQQPEHADALAAQRFVAVHGDFGMISDLYAKLVLGQGIPRGNARDIISEAERLRVAVLISDP